MKRTGHGVVLDGALRQVASHMPAITVQHLDIAMRIGEHHQLGAKRLDTVRLPVKEGLGQTQAVPPPGKPSHRCAAVDFTNRAVSHGGRPFADWFHTAL